MSWCGSGLPLGYASYVLFGPRRTMQYVRVTKDAAGEEQWHVHIQTKRVKTKNSVERLRPLKNRKTDGININGFRIVPVNKDGHIIMADGSVWDIKQKVFHKGHSTKFHDTATLKPRLLNRAKLFVTDPEVMIRFTVLLAISAIIDTGVYEIGKYRGYREAEKNKVPGKLLRAVDKKHGPSDSHMIANEISPIPLTLKPFTARADTYTKPTPQQIEKLNDATSALRQQYPQLTA